MGLGVWGFRVQGYEAYKGFRLYEGFKVIRYRVVKLARFRVLCFGLGG